MRARTIAPILIAVLALVAAGCSSGDEGTTGGSGTQIAVTLKEYSIALAQSSAPAGDVTFAVTNEGPDAVHEFVVLATDLALDALPTNPDGSVQEEGEGITPVDEIEDIAVGDTATLTVSLAAGSYVFVCNIVGDVGGETVPHYQQGMRASFTVE